MNVLIVHSPLKLIAMLLDLPQFALLAADNVIAGPFQILGHPTPRVVLDLVPRRQRRWGQRR
jgi:hypothetical protein